MRYTIISQQERAAQLQRRFEHNMSGRRSPPRGAHYTSRVFAITELSDDGETPVHHADQSRTEHVLKTSKSFAARSYKGRQSTSGSLRVPSNTSHNENSSVSSHDAFLPPAPNAPQPPQVLSENLPNGQVVLFRPGRSPTPSLKRAAVEALKQNHGSPNHVRVTAGGRIVTAEQSPLCQPRYGYSAIKINGSLIKFAPNQRFSNRPGETEPATDQQGQIVEDEYGNHFQIVGNKILPLHVRADGFMELHMAAGNLTVPRSHMPPVRATGPGAGPIVNNSAVVPEPSIDVQLKALKAQYVSPPFFDAPSILLTSFADISVTLMNRNTSTRKKQCIVVLGLRATETASFHDAVTL